MFMLTRGIKIASAGDCPSYSMLYLCYHIIAQLNTF